MPMVQYHSQIRGERDFVGGRKISWIRCGEYFGKMCEIVKDAMKSSKQMLQLFESSNT